MNKRSAMIVAAGLIVALVAGAYALALGVTGPATAAHAQTTSQTSTKTITIHKKAPSAHGTGAMSAPAAGQSSGGYSAGGYSGVSGGSTYNAPVPRVPEPRDGGPDD